jgi:hypothetical protein
MHGHVRLHTGTAHSLKHPHCNNIHDIEEARLLSCMFCVCLRLVVKSSDSGLPKSCTTFQTQIPFTPADSIGKHLAAKNTEAPSCKKHGARVSILCEGVQRGAAEKWCRIMAIHRLKFFGPKVLKTVLESSCRCLRRESDP